MKKRIHPFWLGLSLLLCAAALGLCVFAGSGGSLALRPEGDPQDTVQSFFTELFAGDYSAAYARLADYSSLGLEHEPGGDSSRTLYRALRESYAFSLVGDCDVHKLSASQRVRLRYLDLKAVEAEIAAQVEGIAEELVDTHSAAEIYDDEGGYLVSFTDEVYSAALNRVLRSASGYCVETELELRLSYLDGAWRLHSSPALFSALLGGI